MLKSWWLWPAFVELCYNQRLPFQSKEGAPGILFPEDVFQFRNTQSEPWPTSSQIRARESWTPLFLGAVVLLALSLRRQPILCVLGVILFFSKPPWNFFLLPFPSFLFVTGKSI